MGHAKWMLKANHGASRVVSDKICIPKQTQTPRESELVSNYGPRARQRVLSVGKYHRRHRQHRCLGSLHCPLANAIRRRLPPVHLSAPTSTTLFSPRQYLLLFVFMDASNLLDQTVQMLEGYSHTEWPDLSADRSPLNCAQLISKDIPVFEHPHGEIFFFSSVLSAIARVIGAYCGTSDVLLAIQVDQDESVGIIRIAWTENQSWENSISEARSAVLKAQMNPIPLSHVRKTLALTDAQNPCMALCCFDQDSSHPKSEYPAVFSYDKSRSLLQLSASMALLHPTVTTQIICQICELIQWAYQHPTSKISSLPSLKSDLMSIHEKGTREAVSSAYPHLSAVSSAPDYLALRAKDMPWRTAVRWYPELSLDSQEHHFESMSYLDLHRKANQVAHWLLRHGLRPEKRVAVCLDRNLKFHVAMMGIMRAGGCYVPIDPELPLERKIYIANDANATFVLTSSHIASHDVFGPVTRYFEDKAIQSEISQESDSDLNCMKPTGLAYLLYTSGTTGNPKGCLLTHHGLAQAILALSSTAADVRMDDIHEGRYLAVASIAFDVHLAETIVPFALGMPLLSARRSQLLENLPIYVNQLGVTHLGIVPSLIEATLNAAQGEGDGSQIALRYIASGGEKMSDSILDKWANHPQVRLANFYGPSEVTIGCCGRYMTSATPRANIGRGFANVSAYVVDKDLNILIRGSVGELVVEGPLVGRGYHGRDDLTTKVFVEWPAKGRWAYRTGDLVRMMPDSTLEIVGRIDTQIKLRGVRIESEGISAIIRKSAPPSTSFTLDVATVLSKHPAINVDQLVSLFSWDKAVSIATRKSKKPYITVPPTGLLKQIKTKCEEELPGYMRPSHFIPLSWLPLSSNGKTDEKALAQLFRELDVAVLTKISADENIANSRPCTQTEMEVFNILQNHIPLPVDNPHPDLNVFECGLDSMAVIRFSTDLKNDLKVKISASEVMKDPRLSSIASHIQFANHAIPGTRTPSKNTKRLSSLHEFDLSYEQSQIEDILPPFTVQEGVLARSAELDTLYVQHVILSCNATTSMSSLQRAWKDTVDKHQILRTVFHFGRVLSQVILRPDVCEFQWADKSFNSKDISFRDFFLKKEAPHVSRAINLSITTTPPYRLSSYSAPSQNYLVLSVHHALFDGISLPHIFGAVEREYLGTSIGSSPSIPSEILNQISTINLSDARRFWTTYFEDFSWPQLAVPSVQPASTQHHSITFKASLTSVKALAASQQVTLQALLTAAFAHMVARYIYKTKDVVFGVLRSGRLLPIDGIENAICPLVSVVPTRVNFTSPQATLKGVQEGISSIVEYEHVPLGRVQSWIRPGNPLFDMLFSVSVHDNPKSEIWTIIESEPPEADYALAVEVALSPTNDSITLQGAWKDQIWSPIYCEIFRGFEDVVLQLARNPISYISQSLGATPILTSGRSALTSTEPAFPTAASEADPTLINTLRNTIAEFLQINPTILTSSMSFVSVGLDSIKSVGLARLISKQGAVVTSSDLLRNSTLISLAACIAHKSKAKPSRDGIPDALMILNQDVISDIQSQHVELSKDDIVTLYPTTALQTGMLSQTINSMGKLYVHPFPLRLSAELDIQRLHNAWKTAIQTFSILRTTFHFATDFGMWIQASHTTETLDWAVIFLKSEAEYSEALQAFLTSVKLEDVTSFRRPPLWVRLFKPTTGLPILVFVMHHALYDGISIDLLIRAMGAFYAGIPYRPEKQFFDLLPQIIAQEKEGTLFWTHKLRSFHPAYLQRSHLSLSVTAVTLERHISLDPDQVKETLSEAAVTMQCLCQAAWAKLMSKYTNQPDVVFGHTVSGRSIPGAEDVIGPTLNTIPCCVRLQEGVQNIEFLRSIHQANLDALPWQHASPRAIQKALGVDKIWDSLFLFQSSQSTASKDVNSSSVSLWTFDNTMAEQHIHIQYPLNIEMFHDDSGIFIKCASQSDFICQEELITMADDLRSFVLGIVRDPHGLAFDYRSGLALPHPRDRVGRATALPDGDVGSVVPLVETSLYQNVLASLTNAPISLIKKETPLAALGIDSITAIQIVSKFRHTGLRITASDVVNSRTVGEMLEKISFIAPKSSPEPEAKVMVTEAEKAGVCEALNVYSASVEEISIASSGMKWLIGAWHRSQGTRFQHAFPFQLPQNVDFTKMKAAWFSLTQRHAILRSTFACPDGHHEPRIVTFKTANEKSWTEEYVQDELFYRSILSRMKSLVESPLPTNEMQARAVLFYSSSHHYLILHLHHFQYDAWSLQLLVQELSNLYTNSDVTAVSNNMYAFLKYYAPLSHHLQEQKKYWTDSFPRNFKPRFFPVMNPNAHSIRPIERLIRTDTACIRNALHLEKCARSLGVSLQSIFLASWARLQGQMSKESSSTFGLWHSGRTGGLDDIANLAVPCMNVLPMYVPGIQEKNSIALAESIQTDLHRRTSVVEQSDQVRVNEWVGAGKMPMCNVFLNIVKIAPDVDNHGLILIPAQAPYFVPARAMLPQHSSAAEFDISRLIQDDLFIDIATITKTDSILMSIDAAGYMMNEGQADSLISRWAIDVQKTLGVPI